MSDTNPKNSEVEEALEALRESGRPLSEQELTEAVFERSLLELKRRHYIRLPSMFPDQIELTVDGRLFFIGDAEPERRKVGKGKKSHSGGAPVDQPNGHEIPVATQDPLAKDPTALLVEWTQSTLGSDRRAEIAETLRAAELPSRLINVARVFQIREGEPSWQMRSEDLAHPEPIMVALLQHAVQAGQLPWAVFVALTTKSTPIAAAAISALNTADVTEKNTALVNLVNRAARGDDPLIAFRPKNLSHFFVPPTDDEARQFALHLACRLSLEHSASKRVAAWIEPLLEVSVARSEPDAAGAWLTTLNPPKERLIALLSAIQFLPSTPDSPRVRLLRAIAYSDTSACLINRDAWVGMTFQELGQTLTDPNLRALFVDDVNNREQLQAIVEEKSKSLSLGTVMAETEIHPFLEEFVPPRVISTGIGRHRSIGKAIDERIEELRRQSETHRLAEQKSFEQSLEENNAQWTLRVETVEAERDAESARANDLEEQLRARARNQTDALDGQKRVAQFEALRALAEITNELRNSVKTNPSMSKFVTEAERRLKEFGVSVEGAVGDIGLFDARYFRSVAGELSTESEIETPAYLVTVEGDVTPLIYGQVHSLSN